MLTIIIADSAGSLGLELNANKSEILIRDPLGHIPQQNIGNLLRIGDLDIKIVDKMKYLGVYLTNSINRPATVNERIKSALKICYSITPFFK